LKKEKIFENKKEVFFACERLQKNLRNVKKAEVSGSLRTSTTR
jgi:hypothetical protein